MPLRVAINATPLLSQLTGIGNYIVELGRALSASSEVDAYSLYGFKWRHEAPTPPNLRAPLEGVRFRLRETVKALLPFKRHLIRPPQSLVISRGIRRNRIELYHEPNYVPLCYDIPVITTIHDFSWLRYPETQPKERVRWLEQHLPRAIRDSAAIIVDSNFVRSELMSTFGTPASRVHVAYLGVGPAFRSRSAKETAKTLQSLSLVHSQYVLTTSTIEPRKNLGHTLEAYSQLPVPLRKRYPLVVAGAKGWLSSVVAKTVQSLNLEADVRFLGRVSDAKLTDLYAGASVFLFPSRYEGFGLPPLEAMASGVPVIVSNRASLPEVVGEAGIQVDPDAPEQSASALQELLESANLRRELARRSIRQAAHFTWDACASATLAAYRAALAVRAVK